MTISMFHFIAVLVILLATSLATGQVSGSKSTHGKHSPAAKSQVTEGYFADDDGVGLF